MRPRSRDAVSGFAVQIGSKTESTSAVVISSTGFACSGTAYWPSVITHCCRCFGFFHPGLVQRDVSDPVHSPNVGTSALSAAEALASCFKPTGSIPLRTIALEFGGS